MTQVDWQSELSRHDRWLRAVVLARVREPGAIDEVMQEVALAAVRQQAPLTDPTKVAPWLYRLAVGQSLLYRRRQGRSRKLAQRYANDAAATEHDGRSAEPLDWLLAGERRELVRRAMQRLKERDAEILLLKYSEDWSYSELAAHLSVSHSAVEARLHRARERLRQQLACLQVAEVQS
jgi:RNA polymerase sigma factor (sigma-70 family)